MSRQADRIRELSDQLSLARLEILDLKNKAIMTEECFTQQGEHFQINLGFANRHLRTCEAENRRLKKGGTFYLKLQELILGNDMLMDEWQRFIAILKLHYDDIPGFTSPDQTSSRS